MTSSPTALAAGSKRAHESDEPQPNTVPDQSVSPSRQGTNNSHHSTSNFRNVSACNRCRLRKNRCDQRLPACTACEKGNHRCVGFDPITKQEIPRSYVYHLESRVSYLESLLIDNDIDFESADAYDDGGTRGQDAVRSPRSIQGRPLRSMPGSTSKFDTKVLSSRPNKSNEEEEEKIKENERFNKIVDDIGMVTVEGASNRRYLGSTSGISFARIVLAAVKSSVAAAKSEKSSTRPSQPPRIDVSGGTSMRDSYFGLSTKPTIKEAPFPDRQLGERLVHLYFEHANAQIPVLHREEFWTTFDHAYAAEPQDRSPRQLYLLNIVFAIGAGTIFGSSDSATDEADHSISVAKRVRLSGMSQAQPEEYHASAIVHLSSFLSSSSLSEGQEKAGGDLDDLQAVLLLAGFALLRPVAPGLWYIVGVAMRLAIDLGLHFEDGLGSEGKQGSSATMKHRRMGSQLVSDPKERGKREWMRDLRRRLWWCTYCFDRLVSTCVGRPFGVTDFVVTTEFPSMLDDKYITRAGIQRPRSDAEPSYKVVALHYLRLRLLQSEILEVLQYQQAQQARRRGVNRENHYIHQTTPSPFLIKHLDFRSWRSHMDQRLWEWRESAPTETETGVAFSVQFLELNYWQAVIMLYRDSLSVPDQLATETSPTAEISGPSSPPAEEDQDQDIVFLKCAEAGQKTLKLYRQLHRRRLVNYIYLATHHLFMAGISFLYAVWHSPAVRQNLTLDDFDFTVLAATSVLGDLMEKCPPAEACRDAFERMSKATVQMCMSTPGFGFGHQERGPNHPFPKPSPPAVQMTLDSQAEQTQYAPAAGQITSRRPPPRFDMDLRDLFPEDLDSSIRPSKSVPQAAINAQRARRTQQGHQNRNQILPTRQQSHFSPNSSDANLFAMTSDHFNADVQRRQISQILSQPSSASYMDFTQNTYNPDFMSNLPGLDFLNSLTRPPAPVSDQFMSKPVRSNNQTQSRIVAGVTSSPHGAIEAADDSTGDLDLAFDGALSDSMMENYAETFEHNPTLTFGDSVGFDFSQQHDYGDGQNGFDLFNGFFFDRNGS